MIEFILLDFSIFKVNDFFIIRKMNKIHTYLLIII